MGKRLLICASACFLLSSLLFSCQTEQKASHNQSAAFKSSGKQETDGNKAATHRTGTLPKNYYIANKNAVKTPPKPGATQTAGTVPQAVTASPVITTSSIASVSLLQEKIPTSATAKTGGLLTTQSEHKKTPPSTPTSQTANTQVQQVLRENVTTQNYRDVTIIIKDSVLPRDPNLVAVAKPDTIQFKESGKDEINELEQAPTEEAMPLTVEEMDTVISKYAEMISVERSEMANFNLYFFIDHWYGTRYKYGGVDSTGIDCSAFSQKLYDKVYNVEILRTARQQHKHCERIKYPDDATEGDLLFFRVHHLRVSHVGVYLANGYFVHSSSSKGVTISNLNNKYWRRRFAGCGRIAREEKSITESDYIQ